MKKWLIGFLGFFIIITLISAGCRPSEKAKVEKLRKEKKAKEAKPTAKQKALRAIKITWFGQSMFLFEDSQGTRIVTDPYENIGYGLPDVSAEIVTVSHDHYDHNNVSMVKGQPQIIKTTGVAMTKDITFEGVSSFHDEANGTKRGKNIVFKFALDNFSIVHLGDLGQSSLAPEQVDQLKNVDLLLIPVGGNYTIDAVKAKAFVEQIKPKIVIPMHYKTAVLNIDIDPVEKFLREMVHFKMLQKPSTVTISELPKETEIWVMDYKR